MKWTYATFRGFLNEFLGDPDARDAKTQRRAQILASATELFVKHGYRRTTVEDVARNAGVSKGTVYLYFKSKAEILVHAIAMEKRHYMRHLIPVFEEGLTGRERLRRWLQMALALSTEMPLISRLVGGDSEMQLALDEWDADDRDRWMGLGVEFIGQMVADAASSRRLGQGEVADRARIIYGLVAAGLSSDSQARQGLSVERYAEVLTEMILDGLGGPREGERGRGQRP